MSECMSDYTDTNRSNRVFGIGSSEMNDMVSVFLSFVLLLKRPRLAIVYILKSIFLFSEYCEVNQCVNCS